MSVCLYSMCQLHMNSNSVNTVEACHRPPRHKEALDKLRKSVYYLKQTMQLHKIIQERECA